MQPGFAWAASCALRPPSDRRLSYPPASPHRSNGCMVVQESLCLFPITYAFRPRLRIRLTPEGLTCPGTLGFSADRFFTCLFVTDASMITSIQSTRPYGHASTRYGTLPYRSARSAKPVASVSSLAPLNLRRIITRPVSCYALFK